jgi:diguanylate cyclase (GGDEF)-like protein
MNMQPTKKGRVDNLLASLWDKWQFARRKPAIFVGWSLLCLALIIIGWGTVLASLKEDRAATEERAKFEAEALARTYADRLTRSLNNIDQVSQHVRFEWQSLRGKVMLEKMKQSGLFPNPALYYVTIVDRYGMPISSTLPNFRPISVADRAYFQGQKNSSGDNLLLSAPIMARMSMSNVVHFSRRLNDADGNFDGIVLVSVSLDFFTANYDATILGEHGLLAVLSHDGTLELARIGNNVYPPEHPALTNRLELHGSDGRTLLQGKDAFSDQRTRYIGWQHLKNYPLVAITGLDQADMLASYRQTRHVTIMHALGANVALVILVGIAIAVNIEMAWRKHQLEVTQATYRLATEEGSEGFYIVQPLLDDDGAVSDFTVIDCNQPGAEFFKLRRHQFIGKRISFIERHFNLERLRSCLIEALETGAYESEMDLPIESPLSMRWVHLKVVRSESNLAVRLRDISEAKAHVEELKRRGEEDALTGLPNRHWVQAHLPVALEQASRNDECLAVLFVDLDGFKKVNDTAGHAAGDELLQHVALRLKEATRPYDKVVRFGGDEFVIILENLEHRIDAAQVAERVVKAFKTPLRLRQASHTVGTSIGIALFPADGEDAATLLEKADIAMYSVKTRGKGAYQFYEAKFYNALRARLEKESELRSAIERDEFVVYYQPRIDVASGLTVSMEALVRWKHPTLGLLEPKEFIVLAEETGLIIGISEIVIDKVCAQLAFWSQSNAALVPVSVNVSPRHFQHADVAEIVIAALARHQVSPQLLEMEITESSVMEGSEISGVLSILQRQGIKILVDDFGTGYSSLAQLHRLDFDVLKVDRVFTAEIDRSEQGKVFFTAIVTMAHALGMRVVAEGVERASQISTLKALHCDELQGFYISRPIPPDAEQPVLARHFLPVAEQLPE